MTSTFAFIPFVGNVGPLELLIVGGIALLLFGKRLPEVMRSLGKGIVEFKKGVQGIEDDVDHSAYSPKRTESPRPAPRSEAPEVTAPKFEPPRSEPAPSEQQQ